jgi:methenyltetrahydromethanopterin cyclohydrolase
MVGMNLNQRALLRCAELAEGGNRHRVAVLRDESGVRLIDCGVHVVGGLDVGCQLAETCLAGLGRVAVVPGGSTLPVPTVTVQTDQPIAACLASQYAGWQIAGEKFYAMGSGPMRAARGKEKLFDVIGMRERVSEARRGMSRRTGAVDAGRGSYGEHCGDNSGGRTER